MGARENAMQRFRFGGQKQARLHLVDEERFTFGSGSGSCVQLKPDLWGKLPSELVAMILPWLPHTSRARLRVVSRAWRTLLSAPVTPAVSAWLLGSQVACVTSRQEEGVSPVSDARCLIHELDLTCFPCQFHNWEEDRYDGRGYGVFAQKGLVCKSESRGGLQDKRLRQFSVWVMHWHKKSWKELPRLIVKDLKQQREDWFVGVADDGTYRVVLSRGHKVLTLSVYSSSAGTWNTTTVHPLEDLPNVGSRSSFSYVARCVCSHLLYNLVQRESLEQLVVLDVDDGHEVGIFKDLPGKSRNSSVYLADFQGRPVLLRKQADQNDGAACTAWMLAEDGGEFVQFTVLPEELLSELRVSCGAEMAERRFSYDVLQVEVARNFLFLTLTSNNYQVTHLVAYHMLLRSWRVILHDAKHCWRFQFLEPRPSLCCE